MPRLTSRLPSAQRGGVVGIPTWASVDHVRIHCAETSRRGGAPACRNQGIGQYTHSYHHFFCVNAFYSLGYKSVAVIVVLRFIARSGRIIAPLGKGTARMCHDP